ncbi:ABC transporter ATP-binding protein [Kaistella sp.]|uniref:ABC transporter ATP-binding protein n=1 Tax=Kaistella sp. TaxID=2782235 RepID=UPI002F93A220
MLALKAENISKQYRLGQVGTGTLSHDLNRFWAQIRGKEDPYLKIGESNDRTSKGESEYVWSLRDINFEIEQGDAVGIIGRNGAGKSTLLKLLSKVTKPTTGKIYTNGRIASLLEVGTGFHPEMTGRENIYLNGAILGMTRKEITRKFDEIVDFSGVERYIDTPVKRYSSGMYVRLAFAVAAHLESEILIVDEVLAVGDAEFQKKCLGKMGDVSKGEGRTVLFVSHNMAAVSQLCHSGIYLKDGEILQHGNVKLIIDSYLKNSQKGSAIYINEEQRNEDIFFRKIAILNKNHTLETSFDYDDEIIINLEIDNIKKIQKANIFVTIQDALQTRVFSAETPLEINKNNYELLIEPKFLTAGSYNITAFIHIPQLFRYDSVESVCYFDVVDTGSAFTVHGNYHHGVVFGKFEWR